MDPISTIIVTGASIGVGTGVGDEVVKMARDCGVHWLMTSYQGHAAAAAAKAAENGVQFLNKLALKVERLETESEINKSLMATTMSEPSFSVLLQKAVLASSQTDNAQKHEILSDLASQRLKANSDSIYAVTSQMAVDAIAHCTPNQLKILGAVATLRFLKPTETKHASQEEFERSCGRWLVRRFAPYQGPRLVGPLDIAHLQSASCANVEIGFAEFKKKESELMKLLRIKFGGKFSISEQFIKHLPVGTVIIFLWDGEDLRSVSLTTVGRLIGTLVSDRISHSEPTSFEEWQRPGGASAPVPETAIKAMTRGLE